MNWFNPRRLTLARKRRGITKIKLANAVGLSRRSITAYESGELPPSPETLESLARALDFPLDFFNGDDPEEVAPESASFRALSLMTAAQHSSVLAAGTLAISLNQFLEKHLTLPSPNLLDLRDEDPEGAALAMRVHWKLGTRPISNVVHLLEANGVRVFSLSEERIGVDAYCMWSGQTPFVFLNTFKSGERGRFDAAHELGHLVLHRHGAPRGQQAEQEANKFASAFLMPSSSLMAMAPRLPTINRLVELKKEWKVSVAALARRLHDLQLMSRWQYDKACIELSRLGWRTSEPEGIPRETSQLLQKAFATLREDGLTYSDIATQLRISTKDLDALVFHLVILQLEGGRSVESSAKPKNHLKLVL